MDQSILALLGGSLFIPLAVAYLIAVAAGLVALYLDRRAHRTKGSGINPGSP